MSKKSMEVDTDWLPANCINQVDKLCMKDKWINIQKYHFKLFGDEFGTECIVAHDVIFSPYALALNDLILYIYVDYSYWLIYDKVYGYYSMWNIRNNMNQRNIESTQSWYTEHQIRNGCQVLPSGGDKDT